MCQRARCVKVLCTKEAGTPRWSEDSHFWVPMEKGNLISLLSKQTINSAPQKTRIKCLKGVKVKFGRSGTDLKGK